MNKGFWVTKEGMIIAIRDMAIGHLLSTIHMIERNRMNNLIHIGLGGSVDEKAVEYYAKWPDEYFELVEEAQRRLLIARYNQVEGLVKRKK